VGRQPQGASKKKSRREADLSSRAQPDSVASRTRARVRQAPYADADSPGDQRSDSPVRAYARTGALDTELDADMEGEEDRQQVTEDTAGRNTEATAAPTSNPEQQHVPDEGDDVRVYAFANQGRRGVDSLVSRRPRLERLQSRDRVVEVRRRRYRTRTGRYVLEFEVRRLNGGDAAQQAEGEPEGL
jgi:hypothetical protein